MKFQSVAISAIFSVTGIIINPSFSPLSLLLSLLFALLLVVLPSSPSSLVSSAGTNTSTRSIPVSLSTDSESFTRSFTREGVDFAFNISNFTGVIGIMPLNVSGEYAPVNVWSRSCSAGWNVTSNNTGNAICTQAGFDFPVWNSNIFRQWDEATTATADAGLATNYIDLAGLQCPKGSNTLPLIGTATCGFQPAAEQCTASSDVMIRTPWSIRCWSSPYNFIFRQDLDGTVRINANGIGDYYGFICKDNYAKVLGKPQMIQSMCNVMARPNGGAGKMILKSTVANVETASHVVGSQSEFIINEYFCPLHKYNTETVLNSGEFGKIIEEEECSYFQNTPRLLSIECEDPIAFALNCKTEPTDWQFAAPAIDASLRGTNPALYDSMFFERSNSPREDNFGQETRLLLARLSADDANPWGVVCPPAEMSNDTAIFMCRKSGLTKTVRAYYGKVNASRAAINFINPVYSEGSVNVDFGTSVNFDSVKNGITNPASITSPEIDHAAAGKGSSGNISSTYLPIVMQNLHTCNKFYSTSPDDCSDDYIQSSQWLHRNSSCNPDGQDAIDSVFIQTLVCVQDPEADSSFELAMNLTNGAVLINETDKNGDTETNGWGTLCQSTSEFEPTTAGEGGSALCSLMRWPGVIQSSELTSISDYEPSDSVPVGRNVHCVPMGKYPHRFNNPSGYDAATFQTHCHYENETVTRERHSTTCPRISVNCHISKNSGWYFAQSNLSGTVLLRPRHGGEDLTTNPWGSMVLDQSLTESEKNTVAWHVCKLLGWGNDLSPSVSARNHYNQTQRASQSAYELGRTTRTRTLSSTVFWGELSEVQANVNNWDDLFWIEGANGEKFQRNSRDLHPLDLAVDCYRDPAYWDFTQDALTGLLFAQYHRSRSESTFSRTENKGQVCISPDLENDLTTQLMMCKQLGWVEPVDAVVKTRADYTWNEIILKNEPTSREENAGPILLSNMTACPLSASDIGDCEFYLESLPRGDIIRNLCNHQEDIVVERCEQKRTTWEFTQDRISSLVKVRPSSSSPFGTISNGSFALLEAGVDSGIYPNIETALTQHNTMQNDLGVKNSICRLLGFTQGIISARTALEFLPLADKLPSDIRAVMDHPVYFSNMNCTLRSIVDNNLFDCNYTESSPTTDRSGVFVGNMAGDDVVIGGGFGNKALTRSFSQTAETHTLSQTVSETDLFNELNNVYRMFVDCKTEIPDFEYRLNMTYGGRVEVRPSPSHPWGTVCNKGPWSDETDRTYSMPQETMVALCRMAGMPEATFAKLRTPKNTPVNDDSIVYLQNLNCSTTLGQKSYTLDNCDNSYIQDDIGLNRTTCTHDDDVALFCYTDNATFTQDSSSLFDTEYLNSNDTAWQFTAEAVSSPTDDRYVLVVPNRTATPGVVCANADSIYHDSTDRALCHFLNFPGKITESTFERDGAFTGSPARPTYLSDMNCSSTNQESFTRPTLGACDLYLQSDTHVPYHTINRNDCATNSIIYKSCKSEPSDFRLRLKHQGDPLELTANQALDAEYGYLSLSSAASKTNNSLMSLCYKLGWHNPVRFTADIGSSLTVNTTNPILVRNLECAFPQTSTDHWYDAQSNTSFTSRTRGIYPTCNYEQYSSRVTPPTSLNAETTLVQNLTCHANVSNWEVRIDKATQIVYTRPSPSARWGTVCFNDMNIEAATTLCHQSGIRFIESISFEKVDLSSTLEFPSTPQYLGGLQCANNATFSLDDGILDDGIRCQYQEASEETLLMPYLGCSHKTDTKINCVPVSRTLSITPPPTRTQSNTSTESASFSMAASESNSSELTETLSNSTSKYPTPTRTNESTHSESDKITGSVSASKIPTSSKTQQNTASETFTRNLTDSESLAPTSTASEVATGTRTNSSSLTRSRSISSTDNETASASASKIPTSSKTQQNTASETFTRNLTDSESLAPTSTASEVATGTRTNSSSLTRSRSISSTDNETASASASKIPTPSKTQQDTASETFTDNVTASKSLEPTSTASELATPTRTNTSSITKTFTSSSTASTSHEPTFTASETNTTELTASESQKETASRTLSSTFSASPSSSNSTTISHSTSRSLSGATQSLEETKTSSLEATATKTESNTKELTSSNTSEETASDSSSLTQSSSSSRSISFTQSSSLSSTGSLTASVSSTSSKSASFSLSESRSSSVSSTSTNSASLSSSTTKTTSHSGTSSRSDSPSSSRSLSISSSISDTDHYRASETPIATDTRSATFSSTKSDSLHPSESLTHELTASSYTRDLTDSGSLETRTITRTATSSEDDRWRRLQNRATSEQNAAGLNTGATIAMFLGALFVQPVNYVFFAFSATCLLSSQHEIVRESTFSYYLSPPVEGLLNSSFTLSFVMPRDVSQLHQRFLITAIIMVVLFVLHLILFIIMFIRTYYYSSYEDHEADRKDREEGDANNNNNTSSTDYDNSRINNDGIIETHDPHQQHQHQHQHQHRHTQIDEGVSIKLRRAADSARFPAGFIIPFQLFILALTYQSGVLLGLDSSNATSIVCMCVSCLFFAINLFFLNLYYGLFAIRLQDEVMLVSSTEAEEEDDENQPDLSSDEHSVSRNPLEGPPVANGDEDIIDSDHAVTSSNNNIQINSRRHTTRLREVILKNKNTHYIQFFDRWDETDEEEKKKRRQQQQQERQEERQQQQMEDGHDDDDDNEDVGVIMDDLDEEHYDAEDINHHPQSSSSSSSSCQNKLRNYLLPYGMYIAPSKYAIYNRRKATASDELLRRDKKKNDTADDYHNKNDNNTNNVLTTRTSDDDEDDEFETEEEVEERLIAALYYRTWWSCFDYLLPTKYSWFSWIHMVVAFVICFFVGLDITNDLDSSNSSYTVAVLILHVLFFIYVIVVRPYRRNFAFICVLLMVFFSILMCLSSLVLFPTKTGASAIEIAETRRNQSDFCIALGWLAIIVSWIYFFAAIIFWYFENHAQKCWRDRFDTIMADEDRCQNLDDEATSTQLIHVQEKHIEDDSSSNNDSDDENNNNSNNENAAASPAMSNSARNDIANKSNRTNNNTTTPIPAATVALATNPDAEDPNEHLVIVDDVTSNGDTINDLDNTQHASLDRSAELSPSASFASRSPAVRPKRQRIASKKVALRLTSMKVSRPPVDDSTSSANDD